MIAGVLRASTRYLVSMVRNKRDSKSSVGFKKYQVSLMATWRDIREPDGFEDIKFLWWEPCMIAGVLETARRYQLSRMITLRDSRGTGSSNRISSFPDQSPAL